jgi:hypothetical protein
VVEKPNRGSVGSRIEVDISEVRLIKAGSEIEVDISEVMLVKIYLDGGVLLETER